MYQVQIRIYELKDGMRLQCDTLAREDATEAEIHLGAILEGIFRNASLEAAKVGNLSLEWKPIKPKEQNG